MQQCARAHKSQRKSDARKKKKKNVRKKKKQVRRYAWPTRPIHQTKTDSPLDLSRLEQKKLGEIEKKAQALGWLNGANNDL
jgi:hypothetical protein